MGPEPGHDPGAGDEEDDEGDGEPSTWDPADLAMHRLLEDAFAPTPTPDRPGARARHLDAFLPEGDGWPGRSPARDLGPGDRLGRFRIDRELGRGGFGVVYRATDAHLDRVVALKVPRADRVQSVALWDRFAREARLASRLSHPAIVPVLDAGVVDGVFVLVAAYQEGESLSRWLAGQHPGGMPPTLAASVAARVAGGLAHAHGQGVLHRDLKPSNVLMVRAAVGDASGWAPRITDFGLGTLHDEGAGATLTGFWQGTPPYMAPEQVLPELGRVDARSDIYALGAILYELLAGRPIYPASSLIELSLRLARGEPPTRLRWARRGVPADLETICHRCLERDPARRYATADDVHAELLRYLDGRPVLARPVPFWARLARWARREPSHAALAGLAIGAAAVGVGLVGRHQAELSRKNEALAEGNGRLRAALGQRDAANDALEDTLARLQASERDGWRTAYAADVRLAGGELAAGRAELAQTLLRRFLPDGVREDPREFAWNYLMRLATASHEVLPLSDLRWWRGPGPIAAPAGLDPRGRKMVLDGLDRLAFDRDGLRRRWGDDPFWLGTEPRGCFHDPDRGAPGSRAWLAFGVRPVPLAMDPDRGHVLGPGGRVLVFDRGTLTGPGEAPALVRHPDIGSGSGRVQVVEVPPACITAAFSGDGRTLACLALSDDRVRPLVYDLAGDWRASYPQLATAFQSAPAAEPERIILTELAVSHDGRLAAMGGDPTRLRLFETRTGRSVWALDAGVFGPDTFVVSVAFADDGSALVVGDSAGVVRVLDVRDGRTLARFPWTLDRITTVGFHPDPRTVAVVVHNEDAIRFWNWGPRPAPGRPDRLDHGDEVWALAFADGGETLLSAGDDDRVRAWHLADGSSAEVDRGDALLSAAAIGPAPGLLAVGSFDGTVRIRRIEGEGPGAAVLNALLGTRIRSVACHPLFPGLVVAGGNGPRVLVAEPDGAGGYRERLVETPHRDTYALAFSPDATTLAIGSHDKAITLWDAPGLRPRATLVTRAPVSCLAYSPDGRTLVSGDIEGGLQFWDMPAGTLRSTDIRASNTGGIWTLAFSPDGKSLATGGDDRMVRVRDAATGQELLSLPGHDAKVHAVAFSPDGRVLASGDHNGAIRLWRAGP